MVTGILKKKKAEATVAKPTVTAKPVVSAPRRCAVDPMLCYAAEGFVLALSEAFDEPFWSPYFGRELRRDSYEMSEQDWLRINQLSCEEQAELIYKIIWHVHMCQAINRLDMGEGPLGTLKGREHLALPLPMAGEIRFSELLAKLQVTILPRFGLDKGAINGKTGGIVYPWVEKLFFSKRRQFFVVYGLESYDGMYRFIRGGVSSRLRDWPDELVKPFRDSEEAALDAIGRLAENYGRSRPA